MRRVHSDSRGRTQGPPGGDYGVLTLPEEPSEQAPDRPLIELQSEYLFGSVERPRQDLPGSASEGSGQR